MTTPSARWRASDLLCDWSSRWQNHDMRGTEEREVMGRKVTSMICLYCGKTETEILAQGRHE